MSESFVAGIPPSSRGRGTSHQYEEVLLDIVKRSKTKAKSKTATYKVTFDSIGKANARRRVLVAAASRLAASQEYPEIEDRSFSIVTRTNSGKNKTYSVYAEYHG